jgi:hypothetical protein
MMRGVGLLSAEEFRARVDEAFTEGGASADLLLPLVLVRAVVSVLPVSGAGLSMMTDQLRIPLAGSDQDAVMAERLQTTVGEGPCLSATATDGSLAADVAAMAASWPIFCERFVAETPYRSVASFPLLSVGGTYLGALDVYSASPEAFTFSELEAVNAAVAIPIAGMLFGRAGTGELDGPTGQGWLDQELVDQRMNVWVAVGMLMERLQLKNDDALALLRGYAYSRDFTLDDAARLLTDGSLQPEELFV